MTWLKAQVFATAPVDAPKNIAHFKNGQKWPKNNHFDTFANDSKSMIHSVRRRRRTVATSAFALRCKSRFSFVNICKIDTFHFVCNFWKWKYKNRLENDVNNNPKKTKKRSSVKKSIHAGSNKNTWLGSISPSIRCKEFGGERG